MPHRKIPALRGLYWCLEAWRALRASPQPVFSMAMWLSLGVFLPGIQFFVVCEIVDVGGGQATFHSIVSSNLLMIGATAGDLRRGSWNHSGHRRFFVPPQSGRQKQLRNEYDT